MIKINKDLNTIPSSLKSETTNEKRDEIILRKEYPTEKSSGFKYNHETYNRAYKVDDVKDKLGKIYSSKCAFCESAVERSDVEHFRPKSIYYWLAYSWDNLLYCCPTCNGFKSNNFELETGFNRVDFSGNTDKIHLLCAEYQEIEHNKFVNPEKEEFTDKLIFHKNGKIESKDTRVDYTIVTCQLSRDYLNERRAEIFKEFDEKLTSRITDIKFGKAKDTKSLDDFIEDFVTDSQKPKKEFLAFRRFILKFWLEEYLQKLIA